MIESASALKVVWIKIGCRFSSIFTNQTYNECVADSFGEDYLSTQAG